MSEVPHVPQDVKLMIYIQHPRAALGMGPVYKSVEYPMPFDPQAQIEAFVELGSDIMGWIDEHDGEDIDIVLQVRPRPEDQRTIKDGELR